MMNLKKYKPTTTSCRGLVLVNKSWLWKGRPNKTLTYGLNKRSGRNNFGRITVRHRGGRHKRLYRIVNFKFSCDINGAVVERIEYDPNRSAFIALIKCVSQVRLYIIASDKLSIGNVIYVDNTEEISSGNVLRLYNVPIGTRLFNVELKPGKGGQLARAAGTFVTLIAKVDGLAHLRLPSGEVRLVMLECKGVIGVVSNIEHKNVQIAKAGRNRWVGVRPSVRGVAMNPVDHPHGGGEGKTSGGRHPVSPWGKLTKGKKTRKKNNLSSKYILRDRRLK